MTATGKAYSRHPILRKIAGAAAVFGGVEMMNLLCSVVRTKLVALWIGTAGVGLFGLYNSVVEMFATLAQMGIRSSGVKEIAGAPASLRRTVIYVVRRYGFYLSMAGLLLTAVCSPLLSYVAMGTVRYWWVFAVLSVAVMCNVLQMTTSAVLQGVHRIGRIARAAGIATVVSLALAVPMLYVWRLDAVLPVVVLYSVVSVICYYAMRHRENAPEPLPESAQQRLIAASVIRLGAYLTVSGFATWLVSYIVISFMNHAGGETLMGYYQSGFTLSVRYAGIVFAAMGMEYFPRVARAASRSERSAAVMVRYQCVVTVFVITVLASLMAALAPWVVELLYSRSFGPIVPLVVLAAPGLLFRGVSWCMSYMVMARGDGRVFLLCELASGAICIGLNVACYYAWGVPGIGVSFTLWYLAYMLMVGSVCVRHYGFRFGRRPISVISVSAVAVCSVSATAILCGMLPACSVAAVVLAVQFLLYLRYARARRV